MLEGWLVWRCLLVELVIKKVRGERVEGPCGIKSSKTRRET